MHKLTYRLFLSIAMAAMATINAAALSTSYYGTTTPLASGKWIKIKVSTTGMQQISYDQLKKWGFDDPTKVAVYGYGGISLTGNTFSTSIPDGLPATPIIQADNKLVFYGESAFSATTGNDSTSVNYRRNVYSNDGYYFLTDSQTPTKPTEVEYSAQTYRLTTHHAVQMIDNDAQNPTSAGSIFHDEAFVSGTPRVYSFNLVDYISSLRLDCRYAVDVAKIKLNMTFSEGITPGTQSSSAPAVIPTNYSYQVGTTYIPLTPASNANSSFSVSIEPTSGFSYAAVDRIWISYRQANRITHNGQVEMNFISSEVKQYNNILVEGYDKNLYVWDVTDPFNIAQYNTVSDTYNDIEYAAATFDMTSGRSEKRRTIIAFKPSENLYDVEYVGPVVNQNIHGHDTPTMMIITNSVLRAKAEELANYHKRFQGMDVAIYTTEEIMNEFSSGTNSAMGYRRLAKMFYDRDPEKFKYLLLYGSGTWDNRHIVKLDEGQLLTYQAETESEASCEATAYSADSYFGMLSDSYLPSNITAAPAHIGVGRIPASGLAEAIAYNNKCYNYLTNRPAATTRNRAIQISDDGDKNAHFDQSMAISDTIKAYRPSTTTIKAASCLYPMDNSEAVILRRVVTNALGLGAQYFTYSGHGSIKAFGGENLWTKNLAASTDYTVPPVAMLATCSAMPFDRNPESIGAAFLFKENGGAIAVVGACRTVYLDYNQVINAAMADAVFSAKPSATIGDAYLKARNLATVGANRKNVGLNTLCYNLCGDPALPLYAPEYNVEFKTINGSELTDTINISPLVSTKITGQIVDAAGEKVDTFNGSVTLTLFDGPTTADVLVRNSSDLEGSTTLDETILTETIAEVTNGEFTATFTIPYPQTPNVSNRLIAAAENSDRTTSAIGVCNKARVVEDAGKDVESQDNTAPVISSMYINDSSFSEGDVINSDELTVYATIEADLSGINTASTTIGNGPRLVLDNATSYSVIGYVTNNNDGTATLSYPMSELSEGHHTLTFSIADNVGNRTTATISFIISTASEEGAKLTVKESPARTVATITLEESSIESNYNRLIIKDNKGNVVISKENVSLPYEWDLKDSDGKAVADGRYKAYLLYRNSSIYGNTPETDILVIK